MNYSTGRILRSLRDPGRLFGLDRAIVPLLFGRLWSLVAGPITPLVLVAFLTPAQQGVFYVFGSVLAIQGLFELGFNQVLLQFFSHEAPGLDHRDGKLHGGQPDAIKRSSQLLRLGFWWYLALSILILTVVGPLGAAYLNQHVGPGIAWQTGWWLLIAGATLNTLTQPYVALVSGLDYLASVNRIRTTSIVIQTVCVWLMLGLGTELMAAGIAGIIGFLVFAIPLMRSFRGMIASVWSSSTSTPFTGIAKDVFVLQAKTSLSWITGYFVFQIFNPILLSTTSAAETGYFGMTYAMLGSAASFPLAWTQTKIPKIGSLIAGTKRDEAKQLFRSGFLRMLLFSVPALVGAVLFLQVMQWLVFRERRILNIAGSTLLALGFAIQNAVLSLASFVRAHKQEPFIPMGWCQALVTSAGVWLLSSAFGLLGACVAFFLSWVIALPWVWRIFRRFWQSDPAVVC